MIHSGSIARDGGKRPHHPEPADRDLELLHREVMELGVGLLEGDVVQPRSLR
jgi:hypothetical protein